MKATVLILAFLFFSVPYSHEDVGREVTFCGEKIPVQDRFVADKLMNILKQQMRYINMPDLRKRVNQYFPQVEYYLRATGLPDDLKYLAIVESAFKTNATSRVGAAGFWQIMKETAGDYGLVVNETVDERYDFNKSTLAACKQLAGYYLEIKKKFGISSWVLTAAAYNNGIGKIRSAIKKQGKDYFQMNLNAETAVYVYKIIAVKELFEYPELYMKNFGYNVFNTPQKEAAKLLEKDDSNDAGFDNISVEVNESDGEHPVDPAENQGAVPVKKKTEQTENVKFVSAQIVGKYKNFKDGDLVSVKLIEDLQVYNRFSGKGNIIQGRAWLIDDRYFIDLGFDHTVTLLDLNSKKGVEKNMINKKELVILKVVETDSE